MFYFCYFDLCLALVFILAKCLSNPRMPAQNDDIPLDSYAEKKLLKAFEDFKIVFQEIMQESLKKSMLHHRDAESALAKENEMLEIKCKNLEDEQERFANKVNGKLEMWSKNFNILKNKYRQLKNFHENKFNKTKKLDFDEGRTPRTIKNNMLKFEKDLKKNIEDLNGNKMESLSGIDHESQNGCSNLSMSKNENNESHSPVKYSGKKGTVDLFGNQNCNESSDQSIKTKHRSDSEKKSPIKSTGYDCLKSKRKGNIKYHEKANQQTCGSNLESQPKNENKKQIKRQSRDFNHDSSLEKDAKHFRLKSPEHQILLLDTQDQSLVDDANLSTIESRSVVGSDKHDSTNLQQECKSPSTLPKQDDGDVDATIWHKHEDTNRAEERVREDDTVGVPFLASTPVMDPCQQREFDETMWSAPKSPAVVGSLFPTPEKIKPASASASKEHGHSLFKCPTRKPSRKDHVYGVDSPCLFKTIQSNKSSSSRDSLLHQDLNLSEDMFHRDPMNNNEQHENCTRIQKDDQYKRVKDETVEENDSFLGSFCKKPDVVETSGIKYKYNAVVRKRGERDKMDGYQCEECANWYKDDENDDEKKKHLKHVCRHKAISSPPPATPNGFWSLGFPETQEYIKKGYMLDENMAIPNHAKPKQRKDKPS